MREKSRRDMPLKYNFQRQVPEVNTRIGDFGWAKSFIQSNKYFRSRAIGLNTILDRIFQSWGYRRLVYTKTVWLVKLRISCAIYLRATQEKMASRFAAVTSEEVIQINFLWCILPHCYRTLKQLFTSVSVASVQYLISTVSHLHFGE